MKEKVNVRSIYLKILSLLSIPFILGGCSRKSDCDIKNLHVHKYYQNTSCGTIYNYLNSEKVIKDNYIWTDDIIEVTKDDLDFYKTKGNLFYGRDNWGYLYNGMKGCHDYLEFYYYYEEDEDYTDDEGNRKTRTETYSGWTTNPYHRGVTGEVSLNHYRFFSYSIVRKNGKYIKVESPLVDDIRDVLDDYPYVPLKFAKVVYVTYRYSPSQLPYLKASDFSYFRGPDLDNRNVDKNVK